MSRYMHRLDVIDGSPDDPRSLTENCLGHKKIRFEAVFVVV